MTIPINESERSLLQQQAATLLGRPLDDEETALLTFAIEEDVDPENSHGFAHHITTSEMAAAFGFLYQVWMVIKGVKGDNERKELDRKILETLDGIKRQFQALQQDRKEAVIAEVLEKCSNCRRNEEHK